MAKEAGAYLTIGELSDELGVPQHILRYWETRFPQLRPLQRAGNRRYYRPADVELVRRINQLLNVEGYTVRGARNALGNGGRKAVPVASGAPVEQVKAEEAPTQESGGGSFDPQQLITRLETIRSKLEAML